MRLTAPAPPPHNLHPSKYRGSRMAMDEFVIGRGILRPSHRFEDASRSEDEYRTEYEVEFAFRFRSEYGEQNYLRLIDVRILKLDTFGGEQIPRGAYELDDGNGIHQLRRSSSGNWHYVPAFWNLNSPSSSHQPTSSYPN